MRRNGRPKTVYLTQASGQVDLSTELCDLLLRHRAQVQQEWARRREQAFKEGKPVPKTPDMLFPNRAGRHIDWNNAADAFHRICRKANIGRFRPYALRHTFATLLLARAAPITYVASQLGHSKPTTTLRYYAKWLPNEGERYVDLLDNAAQTAGPQTNTEACKP